MPVLGVHLVEKLMDEEAVFRQGDLVSDGWKRGLKLAHRHGTGRFSFEHFGLIHGDNRQPCPDFIMIPKLPHVLESLNECLLNGILGQVAVSDNYIGGSIRSVIKQTKKEFERGDVIFVVSIRKRIATHHYPSPISNHN